MTDSHSLLLITLSFLFLGSCLSASEKNRQELINEETAKTLERSHRIAAQFYVLEDGQDFKEITQAILESADTKDAIKQLIRLTERRFFLFKYPSNGFQVKGFISFLPHSEENPRIGWNKSVA